MSPRWRKIRRDAGAARGRLLMVVVALCGSMAAVVTVLSAYTVLTREVPRNYISTNPASAQLQTDHPIDPDLLAPIARQPNIAAAELAAITSARVQVAPDVWLPMRIFVIADFARLRINTLELETGAWPPPLGTLLIERSALALSGANVAQNLTVQFGQSAPHLVKLSGVVHDPGLAPAGQEGVLYGYATPQTLAQFGQQVPLNLLKIVVTNGAGDSRVIERTARTLSLWLAQRGVHIHELRVPPPMQHPHQLQMDTVLLMLFAFSLLLLLLGAVLSATVIGGMLSQQVRQIAIMKSIGASQTQLVMLYFVLVGALAVAALVAALPLGIAGGRGLIAAVAHLLNLRIVSLALPWQLYAATVLLGLAAPLAATLVPILAATRGTVQAALQDRDVSRVTRAPRSVWLVTPRDPALTLALRNLMRRRLRFALTMFLLSGAGAVFLTSMNVRAAWLHNVALAAAERKYDLELRLAQVQPADKLIGLLNTIAAVRRVEAWSLAPAALAAEGAMALSRSSPDGGHGSFAVRAAPPATALVARTMLAGRWLQANDANTAVLNRQAVATLLPGVKVGSLITVKIGKHSRPFKVVGIMREILAPATAYVTPASFAAATGSGGSVNAVRIALADRTQVPAAATVIQAALRDAGIDVKATLTEKTVSTAQGSHIDVLVWALGVIAAMMAIVGLLGLAASLGNSVLERTGEFGVMRSLGASSSVVLRSLLYEGVLTALVSVLVAIALAMLPSALVASVLASMSNQDLPLSLSAQGTVFWVIGVIVGAMLVSFFPARRASMLTIKQTLDWGRA